MEFTTVRPLQPRLLELFYRPLRSAASSLTFPCDASGHVDLDSLSENDRREYLYARVVTGHEFAWPVVRSASVDTVLVPEFGDGTMTMLTPTLSGGFPVQAARSDPGCVPRAENLR